LACFFAVPAEVLPYFPTDLADVAALLSAVLPQGVAGFGEQVFSPLQAVFGGRRFVRSVVSFSLQIRCFRQNYSFILCVFALPFIILFR
jgi:hypothetical protein